MQILHLDFLPKDSNPKTYLRPRQLLRPIQLLLGVRTPGPIINIQVIIIGAVCVAVDLVKIMFYFLIRQI